MIEKTQITSKKDERSKIKHKRKTAPVSKKGNNFVSSLKKTISFEFEGTVEELMEELKDQEKQFLDKQTSYELNRYRSLIQKILKTILDEGFKTRSIRSFRRGKGTQVIVNDINNRLLDVSNYITGGSNKAFNLLRKVEEIRGLLLDLLF